jgi:hypothetical protein
MQFYIDNTFPSKHTVFMNRMNTARRAQVIRCLIEGCSINSTVRMTGAAKHTVLKLLVELGAACSDFLFRYCVSLNALAGGQSREPAHRDAHGEVQRCRQRHRFIRLLALDTLPN